ncbi:MAG: hypothetical protein NTV92_01420, partial [Candidatus Bipolaricaulota bacterium]|nr:hypothetical protein [Candidatus Bipolaricaulota bacterium]
MRYRLALCLGLTIGFASGVLGTAAEPALEVITVQNADRIELLQTLAIPDVEKGSTSQCSVAFSPDGRLLVAACG